jgi:hypothetical protein
MLQSTIFHVILALMFLTSTSEQNNRANIKKNFINDLADSEVLNHNKVDKKGFLFLNKIFWNFDSKLHSLLDDFSRSADSSDVSEICAFKLEKWVDALINQESWAISVFDAFGKPPSGILEGKLNIFNLIANKKKIE